MFPTIAALTLLAADPVESGLKPGQRPAPYSFLVATGPQRGQPTCYVCDTGERPMVIVFARQTTDALGKLAGRIDAALHKNEPKDLRAWVTITAKADGLDGQLVAWGRKHGLKALPLGVFEDPDGPPAYKLNPAAQVTVILAVNKKAVGSFAFRGGELSDEKIRELTKAIAALKAAAASSPP
jgi:hypothetical protein